MEKEKETKQEQRSARIWLGLVAGSLMAAGVVGCDNPPEAPETYCASYAGASAWTQKEPTSITICLPAGANPGILQFKDANGNPIPGGGLISAPGCIQYDVPSSAAFRDWILGDGPLVDEQPLVGGGSVAWANPSGILPRDGQEYIIGCAPLKLVPTDTALFYVFKVIAESASDAKAKVNPLLYHGPGTALPPGVTVGEYIEAEMVGTDLVIRSSLADRFAEFWIAIDGELVADLASNVNAQPAAAGQGWITLTSIIPLASLPANFTLSLQQRGENDPDEAIEILSF